MRIRRKIRLRLGNHRLLFFRLEFWNQVIHDRIGLSNQCYDGTFIPYWDFKEGTSFDRIERSLREIQQEWVLGDIFIIQTFPRESFRALAFDKVDFMELIGILADTEYLDENYLKWFVYKKYNTLRITPKEGTHDMAIGFLNGSKSTREMSYKHETFFTKLYRLPYIPQGKPERISFKIERYESLR